MIHLDFHASSHGPVSSAVSTHLYVELLQTVCTWNCYKPFVRGVATAAHNRGTSL